MFLRIVRIVSLIGLALVAALLIGNPISSRAASGLTSPKDRKPAPEFNLKDSHGGDVRLSDYKGRVVLLNFWATWCGPCKAEIPWFVEFSNQYRETGFAVLGVSMDEDGWTSVKPYIDQKHVTYRIMLGNNALAARYGGIDSLPQTLLIDRDGKIASTHVGLVSKSDYADEISQLLRK